MSPASPRSLLATCALVACALGSGSSCSRARPPVAWIDLAPGGASSPAPVQELRATDGTRCRLVTRAGAAVLEVELERRHWSPGPGAGGLWRAPLGVVAFAPDGHELTAGAERLRFQPEARTGVGALEPGSFVLARRELWMRLADNESASGEPPAAMQLSVQLTSDAQSPAGRVRRRRYSGAGFVLWPGATVERVADVPAESTLRFAICVDGPVLSPAALPPALTFEIALDGEPVFERTLAAADLTGLAWHSVTLPPRARRGARLTFSVRGTPAYTAILAPTLGPSEIGTSASRPWGPSRPDVIVFLADTFRADNLLLYGGELDLTPNLDRFADASLACKNAWSVGTFTLSSHATMFTGVYPHQAGIFGEENAVPEEFETLAEFLGAHGYRTGAITDGGIVSRAFALDQGFASFDEGRRPLEDSVAAALRFLDADDGRPAFLFLQTYRVHRPYRVSAETRAVHGERLGLSGEFGELEAELVALARAAGRTDVERALDFPPGLVDTPEAQAILAKLRAHYQGCVIDLDREFERFRSALEARGFFGHGNLVFTSDHGEAFGEHRQLYHKDDVYEEQTRIPFLLAGQGVRSALLQSSVSLLDLAPTVADLADLERPATWLGSPIQGLAGERTLFSFECSRRIESSTFALRSGMLKVIGFEDRTLLREGRLLGAFDLGVDREERYDVSVGDPWARTELERHRATIEHYLEPLIDTRRADLEPEKRNELDELGYGGDG